MTPAEILTAAQGLLDRSDAKTAGLWPRAAAFLARQALEEALDEFWLGKGLAFHSVSAFAQLLCFREYCGDKMQGSEICHVWGALSSACHHHAYETAPTVEELGRWLRTVSVFIAGEGKARP